MDLNHLHLMVTDIKRSQAFYEAMFGFKEKIWYGDDLLFLQNSHSFDLALSPTEKVQPLPPGIHYGFSIASPGLLNELYKRGHELYPECFKTPPKDYGDWVLWRVRILMAIRLKFIGIKIFTRKNGSLAVAK